MSDQDVLAAVFPYLIASVVGYAAFYYRANLLPLLGGVFSKISGTVREVKATDQDPRVTLYAALLDAQKAADGVGIDPTVSDAALESLLNHTLRRCKGGEE